MKSRTYTFKVFKEAHGYWAECVQLKGCRTQAETIAELKVNMKEALTLYLEIEVQQIERKKVKKAATNTSSYQLFSVA